MSAPNPKWHHLWGKQVFTYNLLRFLGTSASVCKSEVSSALLSLALAAAYVSVKKIKTNNISGGGGLDYNWTFSTTNDPFKLPAFPIMRMLYFAQSAPGVICFFTALLIQTVLPVGHKHSSLFGPAIQLVGMTSMTVLSSGVNSSVNSTMLKWGILNH